MATFRGVWPALVTPTNEDGGVGVEALRALVQHQLSKGVDGFYVCGGTGEGIYLSTDERMRALEVVLEEVGGRVPLIVHVGAVATRDAVALASHAQAVGAEGVSSVLPLGATSIESICRHYELIAATAPELPFYPYTFGGQVDAVALMRRLLDRIPNLAGSKYTGPDMHELSQLVALRDRDWTIFSGMDEQCLPAAMYGAAGCIGSTLNFMPGVYVKIRAWYAQGEWARALELQLQANRVTQIAISAGLPGAMREILRMLGIDCGEPRLPNLPLALEKRAGLRTALEEAGFGALAAL